MGSIRQNWGSVVCPSCGNLVGVKDERCFTCGRWNPGLWGFAPVLTRLGRDMGFTQLVMWGCIILYLGSLVLDPRGLGRGGLFTFLSPTNNSLFIFGSSGSIPVFEYGRWWTVLTAGWLHGGLLHIFFNIMWIRQLAPATAEMYGASRMIIIYTVAGIVGFTASSTAGMLQLPGLLHGANLTVGASAPIFGLLGALVYYGRRSGSSGVGEQAKSYAIMMFIFGFLMPAIDNWAHLGGFVGGYAASKFLDPLHPERLDHFIIALVCLGATAVAIAYSIVTAVRMLGA